MSKMKEVAMRDRERLEKEERLEMLRREELYLESTRGPAKPEQQPGETAHKNKTDEDKRSR